MKDYSYLPAEHRPLSPWAYFGYTILFSLPIIGLIFLIIFSISGSNINRRNFARSYWCPVVLALIVVIIFIATGLGATIFDAIKGALNM
ncbi:MAG: ABC transporter permease [Clostridia bacterium]|nr:ABC transporter permease [Clostridia bacterium]